MHLRKTKIIATIGPSSDNFDTLFAMGRNGLDVARINFSHGDHQDHLKKLQLIEKIYQQENIIISAMADLKGPKIRCRKFENGGVLFENKDICEITSKELLGTKKIFSVDYDGLFDDISVGDIFTFDDGLLSFKVLKKKENERILLCEAQNTHFLTNNKGLNAPNVRLRNEFISQQDKEDLLFISKHNFSYVAASFVRGKEDVLSLKEILSSLGRDDIKIIAKIESPQAVKNIDEIIENSNAVMIARGDLGIEVELEEVPLLQKKIIKKCNILGKPVIVATHMLESMQSSLLPTRAEVSDVANAVLDGADAIMLSAETATGKYPLEAFLMQSKIARKAEEILDYEKFASDFYESSNKSQGDAIGFSVSKSSLMLDVKLVIMISHTLTAARKLAKFKIKAPIIALVKNREQAQTLNGIYYGIRAVVYPSLLNEDKEKLAYKIAKENNVSIGETIILVSDNVKNSKSNMMKILQVE